MSAQALARILFGPVHFGENEEYDEFRFKFLCVVLISGAIFTALFLIGEVSQINPLTGSPHLRSMAAFATVALLLWALLRGHPERFLTIAWTYETVCIAEYVSALYFVPSDELRVLWFLINIPGVYLLLGQRAGATITVATAVGLALFNNLLPAPYSRNALATLLVAIVYQGVLFHVFGNRSLSYFVRMRDSRQKLHHLATHDALTGVLNARAYYATCDTLIELAGRTGAPFAVVFVDLDHFKAVNDTHGHAAGDIVLKTVAQALEQGIRASDALGRIGGEEFSIFLPNTDVPGALRLAESLRQQVESLMPEIASGPLRVTASIGVAGSGADRQTLREIQQAADEAMYHAKARGRNRVSFLTDPQTTACAS